MRQCLSDARRMIDRVCAIVFHARNRFTHATTISLDGAHGPHRDSFRHPWPHSLAAVLRPLRNGSDFKLRKIVSTLAVSSGPAPAPHLRQPLCSTPQRWRSWMRNFRKLMTAVVFLCVAPTAAIAQTLPAPWSPADVGAPALAGSASAASGTFTIDAAGVDIWGQRRSIPFRVPPLTGNGEIVARLTRSATRTHGPKPASCSAKR